jgi:hypothetical protein
MLFRAIFTLCCVAVITLPASADQAQPGGPLVVVDNQGQIVGQALEDGVVSTTVRGKVVLAYCRHDSVYVSRAYELYFDQPDCQGNAYVPIPGSMSTRLTWAREGEHYLPHLDQPAGSLIYHSKWGTQGFCRNRTGWVHDAFPAEPIGDPFAHYEPPFRYEAASSVGPAAMAVPAVSAPGLGLLAVAIAIGALLRLRGW